MTFIDIHVLQTVPPSNLNRDDTGNPKSAVYGGVTRSRVSSQAWKRAVRMAVKERLDPSEVGVRTLRIVQLLSDRIVDKTHKAIEATTADELAAEAFKTLGIKLEKPRTKKGEEVARDEQLERSQYLIFLSAGQIDALADLVIAAHESGAKLTRSDVKAAAQQANSIDVAMFGRMVADDGELNVDAAVQVAHAISVHAVEPEFDYFTAVDDKNVDDQGAGMIGTVAFNSATLYRYATINVDGLTRNLGSVKAARRAVQEFTRAFVTSMPTGKQNTFANRTLPHAVVAMVRQDQPVNLAGAFEVPVAGDQRVAAACTALAEHADALATAFSAVPDQVFVVGAGQETEALASLGSARTLDEMVADLADVVPEESA
ncbi:MAG: type I-E CRISPR-associated protein Cas7/Cse4/CasC [Actinomycetales bacterium]